MNTATVNLLPPQLGQRSRVRRTKGATVVMVVLFLVALGGVYFLKLADIEAAEADRDMAQADVAQLQQEVAALEPFKVLGDRLAARNELLIYAMAPEISWASVLNNLALTFPASASLRTIDASALPPGEVAPGTIAIGQPVANVLMTGFSVERYAPGVETVLIRSDEVRDFFNSFLSNAIDEEIAETPVTGFSASVQLDEKAYTGRYEQGLSLEVTE